MTVAGTDPVDWDEIGEIPENLYREPLEAIYADHFRTLVACRLLDRLIDRAGDPAAIRHAGTVQRFLEQDLPAHHADEEEDLFPMLRARCSGNERVEKVLALLSEEHTKNQGLVSAVIDHLSRVVTGEAVRNAPEAHEKAVLFGELCRRHMAWENELVLSLARQILTAEDLADLGRSMAARHGVRYRE